MKFRPKSSSGFSSIMAVIFVSLFSMLAISFTAMSGINVQVSKNHHDMSAAQAAAESGLEYANYLINSYTPPPDAYSPRNTVSESEAQTTFGYFAAHVTDTLQGSVILNGNGILWDSSNYELRVPAQGDISLASINSPAQFSLQFTFQSADNGDSYHQMLVTSIGRMGQITRAVRLNFPIKKDSKVLEYAIASRGRIWLTGDTTIHGDVYSDWDNPTRSPFNMTSDSAVNGTINTVFTKEDVAAASWQLETLDDNGDPMFDENGNRVYSDDDEIQGSHEGINYDQYSDVPGMNISDYNTNDYKAATTNTIPSCPSENRIIEYFPHASGDYTQPRDGTIYSTWNRKLTRHVYENQTFTNALLTDNRNALFKNCTFEGILYVDCYKNASSYYNNVRFENCTFNGVIITDVPQTFKWKENCLYFTGSATFQNEAMEEATILAPHFNVNLGNTNPVDGENNVLTGAIVGGIVDVRGNAEIYGTIISMCDTTAWTSGYVTNIGATLDDGGSETTEAGDIGVINITPDDDKMLPSGITTPIILATDGSSYVELENSCMQ